MAGISRTVALVVAVVIGVVVFLVLRRPQEATAETLNSGPIYPNA
jgi:hypothetical protein